MYKVQGQAGFEDVWYIIKRNVTRGPPQFPAAACDGKREKQTRRHKVEIDQQNELPQVSGGIWDNSRTARAVVLSGWTNEYSACKR